MVSAGPGKVLMVQGTSSHVGKSVLTAALCRIFRQDGLRVAPFKAQNMSNNSYVTPDGKEIGRAQAVQAQAAGIEPSAEMNPILLKPESDNRSQVVVLGKPMESLPAQEYYSRREYLWSVVSRSLDKLRAEFEVVVIEGAGNPAEINLRDKDLVNMKVAMYCDAPVLLTGDIDRGGVFASIVGTLELLEPEERSLVGATIINKFRGDMTLLTPGLAWLEERTGVPVAGVVPYYHDIFIPEEDGVSLERRTYLKSRKDYLLDIAVIGFPHISNFDDFDPLASEQGVRMRYVESGDELGDPDMVILPGTKSTVSDLEWLRRMGFDQKIVGLSRRGIPVIGICGGYQMLGVTIRDPEGIESSVTQAEGLGLLPVSTVFEGMKETHRVRGEVDGAAGILGDARGLPVEGYEIHMGRSHPDGGTFVQPIHLRERSGRAWDALDGATNHDGMVLGTYLHGLFHNDGLRRSVLRWLARRRGIAYSFAEVARNNDGEYDKLADLVRSSLNMDLIYELVGIEAPGR